MPKEIVEIKMRAYCKTCSFVGNYNYDPGARVAAKADGDKHKTNRPGHKTGIEVSQKYRLI